MKGKEMFIILANDRIKEFWGKGDDVVGKTILELLPEIHDQPFPAMLDSVYISGKSIQANEILAKITHNGITRESYFNFLYEPYYEDSDDIAGVTAIVYDVTEQVLARKQIQQSELHFRTMTDLLPAKISNADPAGNVTFFNQKWLDYTGLDFQDMKDFGYYRIIHPEDLQKFKDGFATAVKNITTLELNMRFLNLDGDYRWHLNVASPILDENGKLIMWVGSTTDIHDQIIRKEALKNAVEVRTAELSNANRELRNQNIEKAKREAELLIANKELAYQNDQKAAKAAALIIANAELIVQNNEKAIRAAELLAANSELLSYNYIASHHLQEPLRKIQMFSSIIKVSDNSNLSEKANFNLDRLEAAVERMRKLISDLLRFSQSNSLQNGVIDCDLQVVLEDVKTDFYSEILRQEALVTIDCNCIISADLHQLNQIFHNLFSNSFKFSAANRQLAITITCELKNASDLNISELNPRLSYFHIVFADNGIGFNQMYRDKIFEVFQTLHLQNIYEGTGVGLAIVKKIIANHNGIIYATSELNQGARFDIYIPNKSVV